MMSLDKSHLVYKIILSRLIDLKNKFQFRHRTPAKTHANGFFVITKSLFV